MRGILIEVERQRNDADQSVFEEPGLGRDLPCDERVFGEPFRQALLAITEHQPFAAADPAQVKPKFFREKQPSVSRNVEPSAFPRM